MVSSTASDRRIAGSGRGIAVSLVLAASFSLGAVSQAADVQATWALEFHGTMSHFNFDPASANLVDPKASPIGWPVVASTTLRGLIWGDDDGNFAAQYVSCGYGRRSLEAVKGSGADTTFPRSSILVGRVRDFEWEGGAATTVLIQRPGRGDGPFRGSLGTAVKMRDLLSSPEATFLDRCSEGRGNAVRTRHEHGSERIEVIECHPTVRSAMSRLMLRSENDFKTPFSGEIDSFVAWGAGNERVRIESFETRVLNPASFHLPRTPPDLLAIVRFQTDPRNIPFQDMTGLADWPEDALISTNSIVPSSQLAAFEPPTPGGEQRRLMVILLGIVFLLVAVIVTWRRKFVSNVSSVSSRPPF